MTYLVTAHGRCNNCSSGALVATIVPTITDTDALGKHRRHVCDGCGQENRLLIVGHTLFPFIARPDVE